MIKLSLYLLLFFACFQAKSQSIASDITSIMNFKGKVLSIDSIPLSNVQVKLNKGFWRSEKIITDSTGTFSFMNLPYGKNYKIIFSCKGMVEKTIEIDSKTNYFVEDVEDEVMIPFDVRLINKKKGVNYKLISRKPVGRYAIDEKTGFLDLDYVYTKKRAQEIEAFLKGLTR